MRHNHHRQIAPDRPKPTKCRFDATNRPKSGRTVKFEDGGIVSRVNVAIGGDIRLRASHEQSLT